MGGGIHLTPYQGRSQHGATGANAPARLSGAPRDLFPTYAESPYRVFLVCIRGLLQLTEFFPSIRGPQSRPNPQLGPQIKSQLGPFGDHVPPGPSYDGALLT